MTDAIDQTDTAERTAQIRNLNDKLRRGESQDDSVIITQGVSTKGMEFMLGVADAVKRFDTFTEDNDPHAERDFGAVEFSGEKIFWKIDYYNRSLKFGSPDPANPDVTHRVLTIMLASEY